MTDDGVERVESTFFIVQARLRSGTQWRNEGYYSSLDHAEEGRASLEAASSSSVWRIVRRVTVTTQDVVG